MSNIPNDVFKEIGEFTRVEHLSKGFTLNRIQKWKFVKKKLSEAYINSDGSIELETEPSDEDLNLLYNYFIDGYRIVFEDVSDISPDLGHVVVLITKHLSYEPFINAFIFGVKRIARIGILYETAIKHENKAWITCINHITENLIKDIVDYFNDDRYDEILNLTDFLRPSLLDYKYKVPEYVPQYEEPPYDDLVHKSNSPFTDEYMSGLDFVNFFCIVTDNQENNRFHNIKIINTHLVENYPHAYILKNVVKSIEEAYICGVLSSQTQMEIIDFARDVINPLLPDGDEPLDEDICVSVASTLIYSSYQSEVGLLEFVLLDYLLNGAGNTSIYNIRYILYVIDKFPINDFYTIIVNNILTSGNYMSHLRNYVVDVPLYVTFKETLECDINNLSIAVDIIMHPIIHKWDLDKDLVTTIYLNVAKMCLLVLKEASDRNMLKDGDVEIVIKILEETGKRKDEDLFEDYEDDYEDDEYKQDDENYYMNEFFTKTLSLMKSLLEHNKRFNRVLGDKLQPYLEDVEASTIPEDNGRLNFKLP